MNFRILSIGIGSAQDLVMVRQRARQISVLLGFGPQDQVRIATAVSEIARYAFSRACGGRAIFEYDKTGNAAYLLVRISENGGELRGVKANPPDEFSHHDLEDAIHIAQRLMDGCEIESRGDHGTNITVRKLLPHTNIFTQTRLTNISLEVAASPLTNTFLEIQQQNQELSKTLAELRERQDELLALTKELEDTNRGVVALYAEIEEKAIRIKHADEMKSRFLSNTSHELRTPLSSIRALSKLLLERIDGELTPEQQKQVKFIEKAANDLSELVNDLLDLAKIEAGKVEVSYSIISPAQLFSGLKGMLRPLATLPTVELVFEEPDESLKIYSDEGKITQILRNFVINALKFTERGQIRVSVERLSNVDAVKFSVSDTGIGIAPQNLKLIFEEFSQIENTLQKNYKGTGLGLPLCEKLTKLLNGSISVSSTLGAGSTFFLEMPIGLELTNRSIDA
jgi:signal transduction histidine kinase